MAKISEDTAALVAAQLTQAWATIYANAPGVEAMPPEERQSRIWTIYSQFKGAVTEAPIGGGYNLDNLT